ncbi:MAG: DEAD/DEAH box helicase [Deinococcales bacterium]
MSFEPYDLDAHIQAGIRAAGYVSPTPIQERALPPALEGRDVLGLAQTGTGKTAGFVLPILQRLLNGPRGRIRALIVAPTRELAEQIHGETVKLGQKTGLRSATVYGGVGFAQQEAALRGRAEIVVVCPGRFLDHLGRGNADLGSLEVVVLDEADHLLDMGFLPDVRRILARVPEGAQRMLFSATMPSELRGLVQEVLSDPVTVEVGRREPAKTVEQALYPVLRDEKTDLLKQLLREHDPRSALVFTRTKHRAKKLAAQLDRENHFATAIQGNLSQNKRQKALDGFRDGRFRILVATDIAARGIDVSRVSHVINYDMPDTVEAYIHRIGRTGRMERSGQALTFVTPDDDAMVRAIERRLGRNLDRVQVEGNTPVPTSTGQAPSGGGPSRAQRGRGRRGGGPVRNAQQGRNAARSKAGRSNPDPRGSQNGPAGSSHPSRQDRQGPLNGEGGRGRQNAQDRSHGRSDPSRASAGAQPQTDGQGTSRNSRRRRRGGRRSGRRGGGDRSPSTDGGHEG